MQILGLASMQRGCCIPAWFSGSSKEEMFEEVSWTCFQLNVQERACGRNPFKTLAEFQKACMESPESVKDAFQQALNGVESRPGRLQFPKIRRSLQLKPGPKRHVYVVVPSAPACPHQECWSFSRLKRSPSLYFSRASLFCAK